MSPMMTANANLVSAFDIFVLELSGCCRPAPLGQILGIHLKSMRVWICAFFVILCCLPYGALDSWNGAT